MALNVWLHCANFVMISAIILLIVRHQNVVLNAESNSTSLDNATKLFVFNDTTTMGGQEMAALATTGQPPRQQIGGRIGEEKTANLLNSSTNAKNNSSVSIEKMHQPKETIITHRNSSAVNGDKANGTNNCTNTTHFGRQRHNDNSTTEIDKEKRARRRRRGADGSSMAVENEGEEAKNESGRSSETSSEGNSSGAISSGEIGGRSANISAKDAERKTEEATNCGNAVGGGGGEGGELLLMLAENESSEEFARSVQKGGEWAADKGNTSQMTKNSEKYGKNESSVITAESEEDKKGNVTTNGDQMNGKKEGNGHSQRQRRDSQDFAGQANAQLQNALGSAQQMLQQMPTQIIQIPAADLSSGKAQNVLLVSDNGNVSMSRGLHFLTVSTMMKQ